MENQNRRLRPETIIRLLKGEAVVGAILALIGLGLYVKGIENTRITFFLIVFGVFSVISGLTGVRSARNFYNNQDK